MRISKGGRWALALIGVPLLAIAVLVALFRWDWLIPFIEPRVSAAIGRPVHIAHLHVRLARSPVVTVEGITVANPEGFPEPAPFAEVPRAAFQINAWDWWWHKQPLTLPWIEVDQPMVRVLSTADGKKNYEFDLGGEAVADANAPAQPPVEIGVLRIRAGQARVLLPQLRADFAARIATEEPQGQDPRIVASAEGRYADQPITAEMVGGGVLSLRNADKPWPIDLKLANGPTNATLVGTISNPLAFAGADLKLEFSGPDMALLTPLTGVPIPKTPRYQVTGALDYAADRIRFREMEGTVGRTDIAGVITVDPRPERPDVTVDLSSRLVDLDDLAGFIGEDPNPGRPARRSEKTLPDTPISIPKLTAADMHVKYRATQIRGGRRQPLDNLRAEFDIVDGNISLHPIAFGVGRGQIVLNGQLAPQPDEAVRAELEMTFQRLDISKLMEAAGARGGGSLNGRASLVSTGKSVAELLGNGNGRVTLHTSGGDLSALLVDLSGLRLADAILSALGLPARTRLECFVADLDLRRGVLQTRAAIIDTEDAIIGGTGTIDLRQERLAYVLRTESKSFTIGTMSTDIRITGSFRDPSVLPGAGELAARGGAAVGLGLLNPLLAILPTIQFGTSEDSGCNALAGRVRGRAGGQSGR